MPFVVYIHLEHLFFYRCYKDKISLHLKAIKLTLGGKAIYVDQYKGPLEDFGFCTKRLLIFLFHMFICCM